MGRDVQAMFAGIAERYDRANTVLSLGVHHRWRKGTVRASGARPGDRVLDVASGTGDLAFAFRRRVGAEGLVLGADFTGPMLAAARTKAKGRHARHGGGDVHWAQADAQALPVPDEAFDVASISFGIRNVDDPVQGLAEMRRALRPGGRLVVLEFGQPKGPLGVPYRWYSRHVMPVLGGWLTGHREAYEYLPQTAAAFPSGTAFLRLLREAGDWQDVEMRPLTGGIAWRYVATK